MEEILVLLEEAIEKEAEFEEKNRELNILGIMSDEELKKANAIHSYAINRLAELTMKFQ